jgi:N-acetylmuramoyl-L-alanine amidase
MLRKISHKILFFFLIAVPFAGSGQIKCNSIKKIVIDAGHGGKDPGAAVGKFYEKDIALDVALKTGRLIKKSYPDIEIIYTRDHDIFIPLMDRAEIANKQKADLFISIHVNICAKGTISGSETYILGQHRSQENLEVAKLENSVILLEDDYSTRYEGFDPNSAESYIMFELIQNEFLEQSRLFADRVQNHFISHAKRKDRGVRQAGFLVLRKTAMPSVLIELGFMSSNTELDFMEKESGRIQLSESIVKAFSDYKLRFDERNSSNVFATTSTPASNSITTSTQASTPASTSIPASTSNTTSSATASNPLPSAPSQNSKPVSPSLPTSGTSNPSTSNTLPTKVNIKQSDSLVDVSALSGKWYGIQIMALKNILSVDSKFFKGQSPVFFIRENGVYKYFLGVTQDSNEILKTFNKINSDFKDCFIVSFIDGQKKPFK